METVRFKTETRRNYLLGLLLVLLAITTLSGCSEKQGAREVPVSKRESQEISIDPKALTRPPGNIATH